MSKENLQCFNTQQPEGGWISLNCRPLHHFGFNTQQPEGGWAGLSRLVTHLYQVSTHSSPKAAGGLSRLVTHLYQVSTHSSPKAAGGLSRFVTHLYQVSTHSSPKAAGSLPCKAFTLHARFNTQQPEGGWSTHSASRSRNTGFQHTAARRRLDVLLTLFINN